MRWRTVICEVAGYGNIDDYLGFGGVKEWPDADALKSLLYHSDCDGEIEWQKCAALADRLTELLPALTHSGYEDKTKQFIDGLKEASAVKENVEFQ